MANKNQEAFILYANLMEEVKLRIQSLDVVASGRANLQYPFAREYCFLQLRMLCELIALSCLVAHGDLRAKRMSLLKQYAADVIMKELGQLHQDFYPKPVLIKQMPDGSAHLEDVKKPFLSRADLLQLYGKCGDRLHRGTVKKLMSPTANPVQNYDEIVGWVNKIIQLLREHTIALFEPGTYIVCSLSPKDTEKVQVAFAATFSPDQKLTDF